MTTLSLTQCDYGTASMDETGTEVSATFPQLYQWTTKGTGVSQWPCGDLVRLDSISAKFDLAGDLVDLTVVADGVEGQWEITSAEFNAWTSDVLRAVGLTGHPAIL